MSRKFFQAVIEDIPIWVRFDPVMREWDIGTSKCIIEGDEYRLKGFNQTDAQEHVRTVVDIGANIGAFTLMARKLFPNARVFSIEPDPDNVEILRKNTQDDPFVTVCPVAVLGDSCPNIAHFCRHNSNSGAGYVSEAFKEADKPFEVVKPIPISCWSINNLFHEYDIDYIDILKVDTEGGEVEIFKCLVEHNWLPRICWIRFEWHGKHSIPILRDLLSPTHEVSIIEEGDWNNFGIAHRK